MPFAPITQLTSHPFAEAFSYLPTPTLLLDTDGNIVASSVGLAELNPTAVPVALVGRSLQDVQSQLGSVATAWAYAHSVVRSTPWVQPPVLLPVASYSSTKQASRWWQPSLTRVVMGEKTDSYWLATAHPVAAAVPNVPPPQLSPESDEATQLRDALAYLPGYVLLLRGPEHRISYASPKVAVLLGQNQLLNRLAAEVLASMQFPNTLAALDETYQTGQSLTARELVLNSTTETPQYLNISLQPLHDDKQHITGVLIFGQDATDDVQQTAAVASITPHQEIVEHLPQIASISSAEGVVEYLSPQWFAYTGQSTEALSSHDWVDALNSTDWTQILHELPEHLRKGQPWSWKARIRRHDGVYRLHIAHMVPVRNEAGRISRWYGTITDVQDQFPDTTGSTPNPLVPDPCKELTDTLPQLLWALNPDGAPDTLNQAATSYIGPITQQRADQNNQSAFPGEEVVQALIKHHHSEWSNISWEHQSQIQRHDGELRWFLHRAQPLRNEQGEVVKWYGTSTDINELKQNTLELHQQNEKLVRNNRELDAFVQAAASELRQPIHNLQALFGQMREAVTFHDPDANALLVMADNSLSRWNKTVHNLMQLVKALDQHKLPTEELSLATVTREALLGLHPYLRASGGEVSTHFQSLPTVSYVRPHLLSIITNLLSNSIKQHDPSRPLKLRLESKPTANGRAQLVVQDNGLGIEPSRGQSRAFRSQSSLASSASGLYLIHRIVEDHGGYLDVESVPGEGTTFCVTL